MELKEVNLADIIIGKTNPRKNFDEDSINELAQSIREKGVLQPIIVRLNGKPGKYELVCGERRYRASLLVKGLNKTRTTIPAIVRELTDEEALELQITENLQRKDIHPMEEAVAFKGLMVMKKMQPAEIAARLGKSTAYVAQRLKLNDLIEEFQKAFFKERMTIATAITIARLRAEDQQELWENNSFETGMITVSKWSLNRFLSDLTDAPFDITDAELNKNMGACTGCQFNSAGNSSLFPDMAKATCLNTPCFKGKVDTFFDREFEAAKNAPETVLITRAYSPEKTTQELIKKGEKIYCRDAYEIIDMPERPQIEDWDVEDYDSEEEMNKTFDRELKAYADELREYQKKVDSGRYLRGFVVDGDDKGKYLYISLRKTATANTSAAGIKAKEATGSVTTDDIKAEIQRINDNEKRKQELDYEKIHFALAEAFAKNKQYKTNDAPLKPQEQIGAIIYLAQENYHAGDMVKKLLGIKDSYTGNGLSMFKKLIDKKPGELDAIIYQALRASIAIKLAPIKSAPNQRPDASGHAAAFEGIARLYEEPAYLLIQKAQFDEREKRLAKVQKRLEELKGKLKEAEKANPKKATKKATKKPVKK
ncbi:MAG TPA: ParB/RepB/Spo0J family partition protein [Chitinophagales bacterium]|nr:ParB/RepB/Spo0J family partition protein [Chitinophagales bacterium]